MRSEITGVPGLFVRQYLPPDFPGLECPHWPQAYVPAPEKKGNRFVRVGEDGCLQTVDGETLEWVTTERCVPVKYAGWCFKDGASQDEYAGPIHHTNPWYSFLWAAYKPNPEEPALAAVEEAVCSLRQFSPTQQVFDMDNTALYPHHCTGRLDSTLAEHPVPVAHRCPREILFWRNPYQRQVCTAEPGFVRNPGDYLLGYWMGRYHGFLTPEL